MLTEVTSFFVEFARGNKAAASTKVAAQAAAAVIDLSTPILKFSLARTCKNCGGSGRSTKSSAFLTLYLQQPCRHPSCLHALCSQRPGTAPTASRPMVRCTKQEARYMKMVQRASLAGCLAVATCLFGGSNVRSGCEMWSEPANSDTVVCEEEESPCQDVIR